MSEDIYFDKQGRNQKNNRAADTYTEKIAIDDLKRKIGEMSFGDIVTESGKIETNISQTPKQIKKNVKKKKKGRKTAKIIALVIALLIILTPMLFAGAFSYVLSDYTESDFTANEYVDESTLLASDRVYNILLLGIDTLETQSSSRSDAMILMSLDTKNGEIKLTSFLRDSYVYIPGYGNMKLNAACVYGGPQLVCDTIEYNFGVRIDDYAKVGYDMFLKIIDAVGGVTIPEIDETEAAAMAVEGFIVEAGENITLNSEEALTYCRIRKGQDDFYRTGRQREVISLVLKKLPFSSPVKLINTARDIASAIECSIEKGEFLSLLFKALSCLGGEIGQMKVPADGTWYNDTKNYQAVLVVDFEENNELLNEFIYG